MSFRFERSEAVDCGVRRMAREQIDQALEEIDDPDLDPHEAVHQVRKRCKKIRAIARIVRGSLGGRYQELNTYYRDLARPLSSSRDAQALVETLDYSGLDGRVAHSWSLRDATRRDRPS